MSAVLPEKPQFDAMLPKLQAYARDWAERECTTFNAAVRKAAGDEAEDGSIWDLMPMIDSKRTVALLVELEGLIGGGCKIPVSVIKAGGYTSVDDLNAKLFAKIRERCPDASKPGLAATTPPAAVSKPPSQVLP